MWLDMDDIESATWNSIGNLLLKNRIYKAGIYHKLAAAQFYVNEHKMLRLFDRIFVCSRKDQELLSSRFLTLDIHIHANKIESKPIPSISPTHGLTMLFVGTLGYYPNEEAIRWFVNHVFRIMHQRDNRFALIVAGYAPSVSLHSFLQQTPGITVYANCNDLASVYQLAQLAVTPLHAGGGTKIKVLEAMQYGLPVIATQEAVNGLDLEPGKHYIAAETSNEFIKSCEAILYNSNSYEKMRKDAYAIVNNQYSYTY
ncbi:glycosyltransferase [Filimonas lacunae]|nr:glycosyltransferase [Filimonas lacunae]